MWRYVWLSPMIICMGMLVGDCQDLETSMLRNNMFINLNAHTYIDIMDIYVDIQCTN